MVQGMERDGECRAIDLAASTNVTRQFLFLDRFHRQDHASILLLKFSLMLHQVAIDDCMPERRQRRPDVTVGADVIHCDDVLGCCRKQTREGIIFERSSLVRRLRCLQEIHRLLARATGE
jgi:hypothetical protein